jgi:hypothetical protein
MSRLTELEKRPGHEEWIWPCDCHSGHSLRAVWDADDPTWRCLWVEDYMSSQMWRDRVRDAWARLRGRSCGGIGVVLTDAAIVDMQQFLKLHVAAEGRIEQLNE